MHWILGTGLSLLGVLSIYTGLQAYHEKTSRKISLWTTMFTVEICLITFFYLFQDKWMYIQKQGVILGDELTSLTTTTDQVASPREKKTYLATESCWESLWSLIHLFLLTWNFFFHSLSFPLLSFSPPDIILVLRDRRVPFALPKELYTHSSYVNFTWEELI